jgi:hypothetical protein
VTGLSADGTYRLSAIMVGNIPAMRKFIDTSSGTNVLTNARE